MTRIVRLSVIPLYLALCLILGGSVRGIWANAVLQLLALPIIAVALSVDGETATPRPVRQLLAICAAALVLILIQLIPLPPAIWTQLPGRGDIVDGFRMLGQPLPWLPISLSSHATLSSVLWLLPASAVLLAVIRFQSVRAGWLAVTVIAVTIMAIGIGALQTASGDPRTSPWYFYDIANFGSATGFFANVNHMASLLLVCIPFLAALLVSTRKRYKTGRRASGLTALFAGGGVLVIIGVVMNGSLAGLGLAVPVLAASALVGFELKPRIWHMGVLGILTIAGAALVFSSSFDNNLVGMEAQRAPDSRYGSFKTGLTAASDHLPLGSGLGSFVEIYRTYEDPTQVTQTYMNHVHSDYIELALETGVPGVALILVFLAWWIARAAAIWRSPEAMPFARAATIASGAILAHSLVDYPLRTAAIAAVFAMCLGLMAVPPSSRKSRAARHLSAG